jgi:hypothetical protein
MHDPDPAQSAGVPAAEYERISRMIESESSPVGIDARRTHIIILHRLAQIERRLESIERRLDG